jgi:hypothetical protein
MAVFDKPRLDALAAATKRYYARLDDAVQTLWLQHETAARELGRLADGVELDKLTRAEAAALLRSLARTFSGTVESQRARLGKGG